MAGTEYTHYVARIVIEKVSREVVPTGGYSHGKADVKPGERVVTEVTSIVTKADNIATLVLKTRGHLAVETEGVELSV